jgi:tetrahydromethanopterin S-methyltransferase subunit G
MIKNYEEEIELFVKMKKIWKNKMGKIEKENSETEQRWTKKRGRDSSWNN